MKAGARLGIDLARAHPLSLRFEDYAVAFESKALLVPTAEGGRIRTKALPNRPLRPRRSSALSKER